MSKLLLILTGLIAFFSFFSCGSDISVDYASNETSSEKDIVIGPIPLALTTNTLFLHMEDYVSGPNKIIEDSSTKNNDGITKGYPDCTEAGIVGSYGCRFFANGDFIKVNNADSLNSKSISFGIWFNPLLTVAGPRQVLSKGLTRETNGDYAIVFDADKKKAACHLNIGGGVGNSVDLYSTTFVNYNDWTHVACTYNNSTLKIYVNGQKENSVLINKTRTTNSANLIIGGNNDSAGSYQLYGLVDEAFVYNNALSATQISNIYNQ